MKFHYSKLIVNQNITIKKLLKKFNATGRKTLIVSKNNILQGSITEGDARRALLKKKKIDQKITFLFNKKPKYLFFKNYNNARAKKILLKFNLDTLPIIDDKKKIVKIVWLNDLLKYSKKRSFKKLKIPLMIMAGGKGTRLKPFTQILPKPLIPLKGKAMILRIIDYFLKYGVSKIFISINDKSEIIKAFFKEQSDYYKVLFFKETKPLGTAGSLSFLNGKINSNFFLTNCDTLIDDNYNKIYKNHLIKKNDVTIVISKFKLKVPYGIILHNKDNFKGISEKPSYSFYFNVGLYVISKNILKLIKRNKKMNIDDLIEIAQKRKYKIGIYKISNKKVHDTGNWSQYFKTQKLIN